jgi:hypothetical protein
MPSLELSTPVVESIRHPIEFWLVDSILQSSFFMAVLETAWSELRSIEPD